MGIKLKIPENLSGITNGRSSLEVTGGSIGECLSHLIGLFPKIKKEIFYSDAGESLSTDGKLWSKINVLVNGKPIDKDILATKVKAGDELNICLNLR